jgi:hypothetical protein
MAKLSGTWNKYANAMKKPIAAVRADFANADPKVLSQHGHIDAPTTKRKSSTFAIISITMILVGIILLIGSGIFGGNSNSINSTSFLYPPVLILAAILIAIGVLYLGFSYFAVHMMIANTPIAKTDAASTGFGILEAKFESESGNTINTPITKAKCTFCDVSLFAYYVAQQGGGNAHAITNFLGSYWKGEATYLTDGTGYTALSLEQVDGFLPKANIYMLHDNSGRPIRIKYKEAGPLKQINLAIPDNIAALGKMLGDARNSGADLSLDAITGSTGISIIPIGSRKKALKAGYYYIIESYLPVDQSYAAAGYMEHTDETLRDKPVNVMIRDIGNTNLFSMIEGQKSSLSKKEFRNSVVSFAFAAIIILLLAWLVPVHSMYSCLVLKTNNSGSYCHYINGSTIALSGHVPSQHYTTTIPISPPASSHST